MIASNSDSVELLPHVKQSSIPSASSMKYIASDQKVMAHLNGKDIFTPISDNISNKKTSKALSKLAEVWGNGFTPCVIDGQAFIYVDTGAAITCIGKTELDLLVSHLKGLGVEVKIHPRVKAITGVGGKVRTCGEAIVPLGFGKHAICIQVLIIDGKVPFLLSNRIVKRLKGDILNSSKKILWNAIGVTQDLINFSSGHVAVRCDEFEPKLNITERELEQIDLTPNTELSTHNHDPVTFVGAVTECGSSLLETNASESGPDQQVDCDHECDVREHRPFEQDSFEGRAREDTRYQSAGYLPDRHDQEGAARGTQQGPCHSSASTSDKESRHSRCIGNLGDRRPTRPSPEQCPAEDHVGGSEVKPKDFANTASGDVDTVWQVQGEGVHLCDGMDHGQGVLPMGIHDREGQPKHLQHAAEAVGEVCRPATDRKAGNLQPSDTAISNTTTAADTGGALDWRQADRQAGRDRSGECEVESGDSIAQGSSREGSRRLSGSTDSTTFR